jgi:hypothetical protein
MSSADCLTSDAFRGVYRDNQELFQPHTDVPLSMVHVYCFHPPAEANEIILREVREALGYGIDERELSIYTVRNVAPNKVYQTISSLMQGYVLLYISAASRSGIFGRIMR